MSAATFVHCNTAEALQSAARIHPGWPLVVTGHSMGGNDYNTLQSSHAGVVVKTTQHCRVANLVGQAQGHCNVSLTKRFRQKWQCLVLWSGCCSRAVLGVAVKACGH